MENEKKNLKLFHGRPKIENGMIASLRSQGERESGRAGERGRGEMETGSDVIASEIWCGKFFRPL